MRVTQCQMSGLSRIFATVKVICTGGRGANCHGDVAGCEAFRVGIEGVCAVAVVDISGAPFQSHYIRGRSLTFICLDRRSNPLVVLVLAISNNGPIVAMFSGYPTKMVLMRLNI